MNISETENRTQSQSGPLFLYSDQGLGRGEELDSILLEHCHSKPGRIGYIPSSSDLQRKYFRKVQEHYSDLGIFDVEYFDLDVEFALEPGSPLLARLLECKVIHLSGGDTTAFLALLQRRNFLSVLRQYVAAGGILLGVSAGAMLMCPHIGLCAFFDECKITLKSNKALGLVDFEFYPHFDGSEKVLKKLREYSLKSRKRIYACHDSEGLIVQNEQLQCVGNPTVIENGKSWQWK